MRNDVILFDRQDITRLGLEALAATLDRPGRVCRLARVGTKSELVHTLASCPEAVVVIDYALSDMNGADSLLNIGMRFPAARWVLFSDELSMSFLKKVLCGGAFGVVLKTSSIEDIRTALTAALDGRIFVCSQVREFLSMSAALPTPARSGTETGRDPLTATEREILRRIALGHSAKEIAAMRCVSVHTVVTHRKNIYRKLDVNNSQEAAGYALRAGVVDASDYHI
jgi:DNA-binding NarL/FixJ family response regulator